MKEKEPLTKEEVLVQLYDDLIDKAGNLTRNGHYYSAKGIVEFASKILTDALKKSPRSS